MKNIFKIVVAGVLCVAPSIAQACSCKAPPAPKIALEQSAAVFVGRVTSVEHSNNSNTFQFAVSKKWKGVAGAVATVASNDNSAACGIVFDRDRDYLVYAFKNEGDDQLQTNLCTRTKRVTDAAADLAELGEPMTDAPAKNASSFTPPGRDAIRNTVQIKADGDERLMEVLAQALQNHKSARWVRLNWVDKSSPIFYGTALYDRQQATLKLYTHSHTLSIIPPATEIRSMIYSNVTPEIVPQLAANPQTARMLPGYSMLFLINSGVGLEKYGITSQDLGSKSIKD